MLPKVLPKVLIVRKRLLPWCLLALFSALACWLAPAPQPAQAAPAPTTAPTLQLLPGSAVPILQLHGSGTELGDEQGLALKDKIRMLHEQYLTKMIGSQGAVRAAALVGATLFESVLPADYRDEVHALSQSVGLDERQVMLEQCFLDLLVTTGCSTIALPPAGSNDGIPRMGRNLDFMSFDIADKQTVILVYHPTAKHAFASIAWPGMIGVLSGMNDQGLCLANMEVDRGSRWPCALPYTLLYRSILEKCSTVDEAIALLQNTPRQTANNLMLIDAAGNRAVAEITPEAVHVRRAPQNQALICTNHQRGDDLDTPGRCWRYDLLHRQAGKQFGSIDVDQIKSMLATVQQDEMTMQSMIFEPSDRVLYLATGKRAANRPYARIDLAAPLAQR